MTKPCNSHGTKSHQKTLQQVIRWAENVLFLLVALLLTYTCMYFIQSLLLDVPHLPHTNAKPKPWRRSTRQRKSQQNFTYYLMSLSSAKLIWICYYSRLLACLSGTFPLTVQLGEGLPNKISSSPNPRRGIYSVLIILPVRGLYLWCESNRSYHPNSLDDVYSDTVTTAIFKLIFARHTMVPVKPQLTVWKGIYKRFQMTF